MMTFDVRLVGMDLITRNLAILEKNTLAEFNEACENLFLSVKKELQEQLEAKKIEYDGSPMEYRLSVTPGARITGESVITVPFAEVHENGAIISAKSDYMTFEHSNGGWKKVRQVVIPARPFMSATLNQVSSMIDDVLRGMILGL